MVEVWRCGAENQLSSFRRIREIVRGGMAKIATGDGPETAACDRKPQPIRGHVRRCKIYF